MQCYWCKFQGDASKLLVHLKGVHKCKKPTTCVNGPFHPNGCNSSAFAKIFECQLEGCDGAPTGIKNFVEHIEKHGNNLKNYSKFLNHF